MRKSGQGMRSHVMDIAELLFKVGESSSVSVSKNARHTGVFPRQVTCHFRSKKRCLPKPACREILYTGQQAKEAPAVAPNLPFYACAPVRW